MIENGKLAADGASEDNEMPDIKCVDCGVDTHFTGSSIPYVGEVACHSCHAVMDVDINVGMIRVNHHNRNPVADIGSDSWGQLIDLEQASLWESAWAMGARASTAGELIALRVLESVSRRCWESVKGQPAPERRSWFQILEDLGKDHRFKEYSDGVGYFRVVRNRLAHAAHLSSQMEAESSYLMVLRLATEAVRVLASQSATGSNVP